MASSCSSLDTSANSHHHHHHQQQQKRFSFCFMNTSFTDLLASGGDDGGDNKRSGGLSDRITERTGSGVPKFKSIPPPSLPISHPPVSPSSYFSIPPGMSPAELLESPVLLRSSHECFFIKFCHLRPPELSHVKLLIGSRIPVTTSRISNRMKKTCQISPFSFNQSSNRQLHNNNSNHGATNNPQRAW